MYLIIFKIYSIILKYVKYLFYHIDPIICKHTKLKNRFDNNEKVNIILFHQLPNIPFGRDLFIKFDYRNINDDDINNNLYNRLFIPELKMLIYKDVIILDFNNINEFLVSSDTTSKRYLYHPFEEFKETKIPIEIYNSVNKIKMYKDEIERINELIEKEKTSILNNKFITEKLDTNINEKKYYKKMLNYYY